MNSKINGCFVGLLMIVNIAWGQTLDKSKPLSTYLDAKVYETPKMYWEPSLDQGDVKALFYDVLPYKGQSTRAFAYIGIPKSDKPVPAMVLVHGGGGNAFHEWVQLWNDRGYAAISMSLEGHKRNVDGKGKIDHKYSGPKRVGRFDDVELPVEEQWMYHAVSDIMLGHSLLASFPEVDAERIGITGISWGGVLSSLISGIDTRLKCAMPVYGAGYLYESKGHFGAHNNISQERTAKKMFWDPVTHFKNGDMPTLWVNGDSDPHFSVNITSRSYQTTKDHAYMTVHHRMPHGHPPGWRTNSVPEIYTFADFMLKGEGFGLGSITKQPEGRNCTIKYKSKAAIKSAIIYYLMEPLTYRQVEGSKHPARSKWISLDAAINDRKKSVEIQVPQECMTYYVSLEDERGCIISSVLVEL